MEEQIKLLADLTLDFLDSEGTVIYSEHSITEYITPNGAKILTRVRIPIGEILIVKTPNEQFSCPAIVKECEIGKDSIVRILVEFTIKDPKGWLFPQTEVPKRQYQQLLSECKDSVILLNIAISLLEENSIPDTTLLGELKLSIDSLRAMIFRVQKMQN